METNEEKKIQEFMQEHGIKSLQTHEGIDFSGKMPEPKNKTISEQIKDLQQKLLEVKGRETEKYARIVGYYRAVKNWNIGKQSEYKERVNYTLKDSNIEKSKGTKKFQMLQLAKERKEHKTILVTGSFHHYILFYRPTCPNCPAVKSLMEDAKLEGQLINAEDHIEMAMGLDVYAVPTVVFFDAKDTEIARASPIKDLKAILAMFNSEHK